MKPGSVAKWLEDNADAPPPPTIPSSLPDDTVSTVYPESSVSNPNASRYTGKKHRYPFSSSRATYPSATYLERRPSSAQALYRDQPPAVRNRFHSVSAESRYAAPQPPPYLYAYTHTKSHNNNNNNNSVNPAYYAPASAHYNKAHSPNRGQYVPAQQTTTPYRVASPSPHRVEPSRSHDATTARPQYTNYAAYHSTPTLALQPRSSTPKKPPLLRRIFGGLDWGLAPAKASSQPSSQPRSSSRSSSKTVSHSRSSDRFDTVAYKPTSRGRIHSADNVVYVRG